MTDLNPVDAMTTDYRAMCAELSDRLQRAITSSKADDFYHEDRDSIDRARALLAQPVAEGPTDEELLRVAATAIDPYESSGIALGEYEPETECAVEAYGSELIAYARAALARWGRPTPQPVPVSERLPGPEDCDEQGRCWVFDDQLGLPSWTLIRVQGASLDSDMHWLPANALPTPDATND